VSRSDHDVIVVDSPLNPHHSHSPLSILTTHHSKQALLQAVGVLCVHRASESAPRHARRALVEGWIALGFFSRFLLQPQDLAGARFGTIFAQQELDIVVEQLLALVRIWPLATPRGDQQPERAVCGTSARHRKQRSVISCAFLAARTHCMARLVIRRPTHDLSCDSLTHERVRSSCSFAVSASSPTGLLASSSCVTRSAISSHSCAEAGWPQPSAKPPSKSQPSEAFLANAKFMSPELLVPFRRFGKVESSISARFSLPLTA
jgi:hypothetical protein